MNERQLNASPIVFPSISPKLSSTPSKKLPSNEWQEIGIDLIHLPHERQTPILSLPSDLEEPEDFLSSILSTPSAYTLVSQRLPSVESKKQPSTRKFSAFISRDHLLDRWFNRRRGFGLPKLLRIGDLVCDYNVNLGIVWTFRTLGLIYNLMALVIKEDNQPKKKGGLFIHESVHKNLTTMTTIPSFVSAREPVSVLVPDLAEMGTDSIQASRSNPS
ncbi:hypothetical protein EDC96DRAFT_610397 [Choanephora cucurbitarum]|nr:hypothetical protein EDC96DRAFT_610397 [Choanephora cucurbitarum]